MNNSIGLPSGNITLNQCQPLHDEPYCLSGLYCPFLNVTDPTTIPSKCPPVIDCELQRLLGNQCNGLGNYSNGAQGPYEPIVCPPGNYCPTPAEMLVCPKGFFCSSGTITPTKCDSISICPEGSSSQKSFIGVFLFLAMDLILIGLCVAQYLVDGKRKTRLEKSGLLIVEERDEKDISAQPMAAHVKDALVQSFHKAMNGKELRMHFEMVDLGYTLPSGKSILQGVTGEIHASRMTAIMGPSGAGKTTFMNALLGKVSRTSGKLFISGKEIELSEFKKIYGFCPQEDVMHRELTVRENILHSARMRLPRSWSEKEIQDYVSTILDSLNLSDVAETPIGDGVTRGISGGQRKRVNIGMELAATPLCLCLDEPTTGLDATAALEVVDTLQQVVTLGMTVIAVIHQPRIEIFRKFDDVLMIVPGGRTAYFGPVMEARPYFEALGFKFVQGGNDADTLMDILSGQGIFKNSTYTIDFLVHQWKSKNLEEKLGNYTGGDVSDLDSSLPGPKTSLESPSISHNSANDASSVETAGLRVFIDHESMGTVVLLEQNDMTLSMNDFQFHELAPVLSKEKGASFLKQLCHATSLAFLQQYRNISGLFLELFVAAAFGLLMGVAISDYDQIYIGILLKPFTPLSTAPRFWLCVFFPLIVGMSVALCGAPAGVLVFSEELEVYWRKAYSGHSPLAYYIGKTMATLPRIILVATHYAALIYLFTSPVITFAMQYWIILLLFFCIYGLSAFVSMVVKREKAVLLAVLLAMCNGIFCGVGPTLRTVKKWNMLWFWYCSYNMYATEAYVSETMTFYDHIWDSSLPNTNYGYQMGRVGFDLIMMFVIGLVWRTLGYFCMVYLNREKQR